MWTFCQKNDGKPSRDRSLKPVIDFLTSNGSLVLLFYKEGFFVVLPEGNFAEKANAAVQNYRQVTEQPAKKTKSSLKATLQTKLEKGRSRSQKRKETYAKGIFRSENTRTRNSISHSMYQSEIPGFGRFRIIYKNILTYSR